MGGGGGRHYERLIGVFKSSFRKTVGKGLLSFPQLEDIVIDVEMVMNARPLMYLEDDIEQPVLTPNSFQHGGPCIPADLEPHQVDNRVLKQGAKRVKNAKKAMWRRWTREYLTALREVYKGRSRPQPTVPTEGEIVVIEDTIHNRNAWKLAKVSTLLIGKDGKVRGARLKIGQGEIERPIQALYPLELHADPAPVQVPPNPNQEAQDLCPKRRAAKAAEENITVLAQYEKEDF